ncbi:hypothetical protein ACOMHN_052601 [Nucella lapillus]
MAEGGASQPPGAGKATECPVCNEEYTDPKLLHCNHLVCRKCVLDWLQKTNRAGGCPLCRASILPRDSVSSQDDLHTLVDALPTELTTLGLVEGSKILSGRNVCMQCDNNAAAASFCLQCRMKLCGGCAKAHKKILMLKNHVIEQLSDLTLERLAEINRSPCKSHDDRLTEMYCPAHQLLICMMCAKTTHWECQGVKAIEDAALERRGELRQEVSHLREKESATKAKMKEKTDMLKTVRVQLTDLFRALQKIVERNHQEANKQIKELEDRLAVPQMDADRATVKSNADVIDSWVETAPDDALLEMTNKLRPRLNELKQRIAGVDTMKERADVVFNQDLPAIDSFIKGLWKIRYAQLPVEAQGIGIAEGAKQGRSNPKPTRQTSLRTSAGTTGAQAAAVGTTRTLKLGDRVRRGPDWRSGNEDGGGRGTVIAIPSLIRKKQGCDPQDYADVHWDNGLENCHRMGRYGSYDLQLV